VKIVVDSYAWVEIFIGSQKGDQAKEIITKAYEIYTPDIVLAEVARKYLREGMTETTIVKRLTSITEASNIVPIEVSIAVEAAKSYEELKRLIKQKRLTEPSLFDAIVLAVTRTLKAKVLTGDEHFKNFPETIWIGD